MLKPPERSAPVNILDCLSEAGRTLARPRRPLTKLEEPIVLSGSCLVGRRTPLAGRVVTGRSLAPQRHRNAGKRV